MSPPRDFVRNRAQLTGHGETALRRIALDIADQALAAADPYAPALAWLTPQDGALRLPGGSIPLKPGQRVFFVGAGKASGRIAEAAEAALDGRLTAGLVICKQGEEHRLGRIAVRHAAHPIADEAGWHAAQELTALIGSVRPGDVVIAGFTGGSSALFPLPAEGLTLADLQQTAALLLGCGANIVEINAVRKHISAVGGGRLAARLPAGTHLVNLTVSDVIGDPLDYITDPTVPDTSTLADARRTLSSYDLWVRVPARVASFLADAGPARETPRALPGLDRHDLLLVTSAAPCDAAAGRAAALGHAPLVLTTALEGESREVGRMLAAIAREMVAGRRYGPPRAVILGGETVVTLETGTGLGGPNQEIAVAAAAHLDGVPGCLVCALGTDGTDGPTAFAGGLADGSSAARARALGLDLGLVLRRHATGEALARLGDAIDTGPTGTNVSDLVMILADTDTGTATEPAP